MIEAELVAAALTMKEGVFCSNMMLELDFDESFGSRLLYIDNTSALHVAGNQTFSARTKHIALRYFFPQGPAKKGNVSILSFKNKDLLAGVGIKHLSKHRHGELIKLLNEFKA